MAFKRFRSIVPAKSDHSRKRSAASEVGSAPEPAADPADTFRRRYVDISGVRLAYLESGAGEPIVLVHGNMLNSLDFVTSGIAEPLAKQHRVIIFDRPGFGRTKRPRGSEWTPMQQAALLHAAMSKLDIERPIVVGHSLGSLVSVALALANPHDVRALVLLAGYYYPSMPAIAPILAFAKLPVVGSVMRVIFAPTLGRLLRPAIAKQLFAPAPVAKTFAPYPRTMPSRASHLRAATEDASYLDPATKLLEGRYGDLRLPVEVLAGNGDAIVGRAQSERFARDVPDANSTTIPGAGHMLHYFAPERVIEAIEAAERRSELIAVS